MKPTARCRSGTGRAATPFLNATASLAELFSVGRSTVYRAVQRADSQASPARLNLIAAGDRTVTSTPTCRPSARPNRLLLLDWVQGSSRRVTVIPKIQTRTRRESPLSTGPVAFVSGVLATASTDR